MLGKERFTGISNDFLSQYAAHSKVGKLARQQDANEMLAAMQQIEKEVQERERINAECRDRIDNMMAEHQLNMDYLFTFGIRCEHRDELMTILQENSQHGGMTLLEATALANARARHEEIAMPDPGYNVNGL
ncbi:hypothetical protein [Mariniblastus fucicola]|uniref:Uncharacterized protein n=1 Tax=Mariniblastus fucicola TaxID=980251 RepID=A0A5B9P3P0_9BACT|nr:hypothetical protein [Mariniblastus fucicola]QEG21018.1 hypothetical protein MFFC18_08700 [Mariniblastus fucicola]